MKRIINQIFVYLYLGTALVPFLGSADVAATQILYLQMVNVLGILYFSLFQRENFKNIFEEVSSRKQIFLFFLFIIWSILTISQSINIGESLRVLSNLVVYLTSFILLLFYLKGIKNVKSFFISSVLILLGIEVFYIFFLFLSLSDSSPFSLSFFEAFFAYIKSSFSGIKRESLISKPESSKCTTVCAL